MVFFVLFILFFGALFFNVIPLNEEILLFFSLNIMFFTVYGRISPLVSVYFSTLNEGVLENYGTALKNRVAANLLSVQLQTAQLNFAHSLDPYLVWFTLRLESYLSAQTTDRRNSLIGWTATALFKACAARLPAQTAQARLVSYFWQRVATRILELQVSEISTPATAEKKPATVSFFRVYSWLL